MANYMSAKGGKISDYENWGKGNYYDGAIGYFKPVKKYGVFEIYGGIKVFVQPSIGLTFKGFDIAASTRVCVLTFNSVLNQISGNVSENSALNNISNQSHLFLEPAITIRGGWKYVKLQLQASTSSYFNNPDLHFETYHIGIGLYIAIASRYK